MTEEPKKIPQELRDEFARALTDDAIEKRVRELGLTAPRITKQGIEAKISSIQYMQVPPDHVMTICVITMKSGFSVVGHSAPASPANFDKDLGRKIAYDNAFRQLWAFEGYLLKEALYVSAMVAERERKPADPTDTQAAMGHHPHD